MMTKRIYALLAALCIALGCLAGCNTTPAQNQDATTVPTGGVDGTIDYAGEVKLDMESAPTGECCVGIGEYSIRPRKAGRL